MDWNKVVGSKGRAHFKQRTYTNNSGEEKTINDIDKFYDYNPDFFKAIDNLVVCDDDGDIPF